MSLLFRPYLMLLLREVGVFLFGSIIESVVFRFIV
jgi:hypothetical protein